MYESFYSLRAKPFSLLPDPEFLYLGKDHGMTLRMLEYGLLTPGGFTVITGQAGCGKTIIARHLIKELGAEVDVGFIPDSVAIEGELLEHVLLALGVEYPETTRAKLRQLFVEFLLEEHASKRRVVLVVDEAQSLSIGTLEELLDLIDINVDREGLLSVVLFGQTELWARLTSADLKPISRRIAAEYQLHPLTQGETREYISHRLQIAGGNPELFTGEACEHVFRETRGIPLLINRLSEMCLICGHGQGKPRIDESVVVDVVTAGVEGILAEGDSSSHTSILPVDRAGGLFSGLQANVSAQTDSTQLGAGAVASSRDPADADTGSELEALEREFEQVFALESGNHLDAGDARAGSGGGDELERAVSALAEDLGHGFGAGAPAATNLSPTQEPTSQRQSGGGNSAALPAEPIKGLEPSVDRLSAAPPRTSSASPKMDHRPVVRRRVGSSTGQPPSLAGIRAVFAGSTLLVATGVVLYVLSELFQSASLDGQSDKLARQDTVSERPVAEPVEADSHEQMEQLRDRDESAFEQQLPTDEVTFFADKPPNFEATVEISAARFLAEVLGLERRDQLASAVAAADRGLTVHPGHAGLLALRERVSSAMSARDRAERQRRALNVASLTEQAQRARADSDLDAALAYVEQGLLVAPDSEVLQRLFAELQADLLARIRQGERLDELQTQAIEAQQAGDLQGALVLTQKALDIAPDNADLRSQAQELSSAIEARVTFERRVAGLLVEAAELKQKDDLEGALEVVEQGQGLAAGDQRFAALARSLREAIAHRDLVRQATESLAQATVAQSDGRLTDALQLAESGLELVPDDSQLRALHSELSAAVAEAERVRMLVTDLLRQSGSALDSGELDRARSLALSALELEPANEQAAALIDDIGVAVAQRERIGQQAAELIQQAQVNLNDGELSAALADVDRGLTVDPENERLQALANEVRLAIGRRQQTLQVLLLESQLRQQRGDLEEALGLVAQGLEMDPDFTPLFQQQSALEQAMAERDRLAGVLADTLLQARGLSANGQLESALAVTRRGLEINSTHSELLEQERSLMTAIETREQRRLGQERRRQQLASLTERARDAYRNGDLEGSLALVDEAVELESNDEALLTLRSRLEREMAEAQMRQRVSRLFEEAREQERAGDLAGALAKVGQALALDSGNEPMQEFQRELEVRMAPEPQRLETLQTLIGEARRLEAEGDVRGALDLVVKSLPMYPLSGELTAMGDRLLDTLDDQQN